MIQLDLKKSGGDSPTILCIGCHSDDIEIGCGGALLKLADQYQACQFHWAVFSAIGIREAEARQGASSFLGSRLKAPPLLYAFQDGFMPYHGAEIKAVFEQSLKPLSPDIVFTHHKNDAHQDHRLISELTWNTFRDHLILEYEIPKYDGDLGQPGFYVPLDRSTCEKKVHYIIDSFPSQSAKHWFEESTFMALMRLRGMECNAPSSYAEAFYCRKLSF